MAALVGAGLLAVVLVLSRTPGASALFSSTNLFRAALVVHVDLSVLVWFMAFAGVLTSIVTPDRWVPMGWLAWALAALGTCLMLVSPFLDGAQPLLNNYIPVLDQGVFLAGLLACGAGFGMTLLRCLLLNGSGPEWPAGERALRQGVRLAALAGAMAWLAFGWTWLQLPATQGTAYFELLFWGPGHVLQFQHALLLGVAWLWLVHGLGAQPPVSQGRWLRWAVMLAAVPLAAVPVLYVVWPVGSPGHLAAFTELMQWGHLWMLPLGALVLTALPGVWRAAPSPQRSALLFSLLLFATGGVLAYMIRGVNVVVPAHYHGSIVGVTLAFMGLTYALLPLLGYRPVQAAWARWQPVVYGGGQLMHILGLAWSGGYGVQRKVAGAQQVLTTLPEKIGMGMMGLGGLIAIIGGVMFAWACIQSMRPRAVAEG
ncbi:cbb3-type cytochrome c oxidase subunit I [Ideonella sp. 4Y16]|uniref:Cbb3-type cytochrome c oxidase subunit I n=1 Tax=Ideonella alba TaxID=2824118 RepID=A0A940YIC7_9BURK|nr:cbb3-type cytochrome c oxidase subunit I [Ideonella alba]MBQ0930449.1 cbb3-type cytochrome c oxidase subunit I [Ideonella alba]MBQ0945301.1 cbb3-type cytochrome c oxidase subunit I [Ideonella alba]